MMGMKKDADGRHRHWLDVLTEVKKDMTFAEMKLAGQVSATRAIPRSPCFCARSTLSLRCVHFRAERWL